MPGYKPRFVWSWIVAALAAIVMFGGGGGVAPVPRAEAATATATVYVTVWKSVSTGNLYLSTSPDDRDWTTLNTPLDMSQLSASGKFYQGSRIPVDVPVEVAGAQQTVTVYVTVYVTVWKSVRTGNLYLSTSPDDRDWTTLNTPLDMSQLSASGKFYQGSRIPVDVPVEVADAGVAADRAALVAFYHATDGPNWTNNDGWLSDGPLDSWHGVTTDAGRVTVLNFYDYEANVGNGLSGAIPPEIGSLTNLWFLGLQANQLSGAIPPELGNLTKLRALYLSENQLSGAIPPEFGNLASLQWLVLHKNQLSGEIPPELGDLTNLTWVWLSGNQLTGCIPASLADVETNDFADAGLSVCQDEAGIAADRAALIAFYHATDGPNWTNNDGWLSDGPLDSWHGVTTDAGRVTEIDLFDYEARVGNGLSGTIPPEIGDLTNLERLVLYDSQLSGAIPPELGNLANLELLILGQNQLSGAIPPELGNLTSLETLILDQNQLSGSIPPELGSLTNLQYLYLWENQLSGAIPSEIGDLTNLTGLFLQQNQLSGEIPPELGSLTNLQWLHLSGNQLTGCIPAALADVENNDFADAALPICGSEGDRAALVAFYHATDGPNWTNNDGWLSDGPLDSWHGVTTDAGRVTAIDLLDHEARVGNGLSGAIPPEISNLAHLEFLSLPQNNLSGAIPPELGKLMNLRTLNLGENQLSGEIPPELGTLTNLEHLHLWLNQLSGERELRSRTWCRWLLAGTN